MELITPSVDIWEQDTSSPIEGMYAHIARCTRVCYQSESNLKASETPEDFVNRVILRHDPWNSEANHLAMLEHGTVYLCMPGSKDNPDGLKYANNKYSIANYAVGAYHITTNFRVIVENGWFEDMEYIVSPSVQHARRVTVSFITNIGVTREYNRHRVNSIAEESTRYCNYSKRNDGQLKIGTPAWMQDEDCPQEWIRDLNNQTHLEYATDLVDNDGDVDDIWDEWAWYFYALQTAEYCYNALIRKGWKPQQAREVLPLATKSQLIHTAFVDDWKHFFALRAEGVSGPPHPNARFLAKPLKEEFIKRGLL